MSDDLDTATVRLRIGDRTHFVTLEDVSPLTSNDVLVDRARARAMERFDGSFRCGEVLSKPWKDPDLLHHLYVERFWSRPRIAEEYGSTDRQVKYYLKKFGIRRDETVPQTGLAAKLFRMHPDDVVGETA